MFDTEQAVVMPFAHTHTTIPRVMGRFGLISRYPNVQKKRGTVKRVNTNTVKTKTGFETL